MMDDETRDYIAKLVNDRAQRLKKLAEVEGACAFLRDIPERHIPNERFLKNTINNVNYSNKKTDEDMMWKAREKLIKAEKKIKKRHRRRYKESKKNSKSIKKREKEKEWDEERLDAFLLSKKARGRGGIGSKQSVVGPLMPDCLRMTSPPPPPPPPPPVPESSVRRVSGPDKATWLLHNSLNQKISNLK